MPGSFSLSFLTSFASSLQAISCHMSKWKLILGVSNADPVLMGAEEEDLGLLRARANDFPEVPLVQYFHTQTYK